MKINEYIITSCKQELINTQKINSLKSKLPSIAGNMITLKYKEGFSTSILFTKLEIKAYIFIKGNNRLVLEGSDISSLAPTDYLKIVCKNNTFLMSGVTKDIKESIIFSYQLLSIISAENLKKNMNKKNLYEEIFIPKYSLKYFLIKYDYDNDYFLIDNQKQEVSIMRTRNKNKDIYVFPAREHIRILSNKNTERINDDNELLNIINEIILASTPENTPESLDVKEILDNNGYSKKHKVERMVGYICEGSVFYPQFHTWLLIDDKHLIDIHNKEMLDFIDKEREKIKLIKEEFSQVLQEKAKNNNELYSNPFIYGNVREDTLYIGYVNNKDYEFAYPFYLEDIFSNGKRTPVDELPI